MAPIRLILSPFDSGRHGERMGAGPRHLVANGAADRLGATEVVTVDLENPGFPQEVRAAAELQRAIAREAAAARSAGATPVVLAGNCNATVGVVAGMTTDVDDLAVLWLDAHGDLNTPDTTTSGFVDGMALSVLTGRCWPALAATVPGFRPVPDEHALLIGARDLEPAEETVLAESAIRLLPANADAVADAVRQFPARVRRVHLHVDLDVHDAQLVGQVNEYAAPGGPDAAGVRRIVETVGGLLPVVSATFAAYDPAFDTGDAVLTTALDLLASTAGVLRP